jgi:hypothetical protein
MKRIALFLLPLFVLTACERGVPTALDLDVTPTASVVAPNDASTPTNVNLASASTVQLIVPGVTLVPIENLVVTSTGSWDSDEHTINPGCPVHFQDTDGDEVADALFLHFDVATLFPYASADEMVTDVITLTLTYTLVDGTEGGGDYYVQLVWNAPKGFQGGR